MGGYAAYVWPSYALTFAVVVLNIVWARRLPRYAGGRRRDMTPRQRRMALVAGIVVGVGIAGHWP